MAQILIRPPDDLKEQLKQEAKKQGFTMNSLVIQILWDWMKHQEK